jgi:hypothetical protein
LIKGGALTSVTVVLYPNVEKSPVPLLISAWSKFAAVTAAVCLAYASSLSSALSDAIITSCLITDPEKKKY